MSLRESSHTALMIPTHIAVQIEAATFQALGYVIGTSLELRCAGNCVDEDMRARRDMKSFYKAKTRDKEVMKPLLMAPAVQRQEV